MTSIADIRKKFPQYSEVSDGDLLMAIHQTLYPTIHIKDFMGAIDGSANAQITITRPEYKDYWRVEVQKPRSGESDRERQTRLEGTATGDVSTGGAVGNIARSGLQGITLGHGDEVVAAGASLLSGNPYSYELERERARLDLGRRENPVASTVSEIGGAMAIPLGAVGGATTRGAAAMQGAKTGAVMGAGYGFGVGEGFRDRLEGAAKSGVAGGALGGALGAAVPAATRSAQDAALRKSTKAVAKTAPAVDDLRAEAKRIYALVDQKGVAVREDVFGQFADDLSRTLATEGIDEVLTPTAARGLKRILQKAESGQPVSIREIETLRRVVNSTPKMAADADVRLVGAITGNIDDFVSRLVDGDVVSNAGAQGVGKDLKAARAIWSKVKKSERITQAIEAAEDVASGFENGLRVEFRKLLRDKKFMAGATDAEKAAIREVTRGSKVGNWLKRAGKIGFGRGQQSNVLSGVAASGVAGGLGTLIGGPGVGAFMAGAAPVVGQMASKGSEAVTSAAARRAAALAAAGGKVPALAPTAIQRMPANALSAAPRGAAPVLGNVFSPR